jgi:hypothetical protein
MLFKKEYRNWTEYRNLPNVQEVDLHLSKFGPHDFWSSMEKVKSRTLDAIKSACEGGQVKFVLFTHGWSTSRRGRTTARSQVRSVMRSKDATPFIDRKRCIQHDSVFVAAIRPRREPGLSEECTS